MKTCIRCEMTLPRHAFGLRRSSPDGTGSACLICESIRMQVRKHGIAALMRDDIAEAQDGCAICGRLEPGAKGWVIDHDRSCCTGDQSCDYCRRAILCQWCNSALGYARDNPTTLRRMADYLECQTRLADGSPTWEP